MTHLACSQCQSFGFWTSTAVIFTAIVNHSPLRSNPAAELPLWFHLPQNIRTLSTHVFLRPVLLPLLLLPNLNTCCSEQSVLHSHQSKYYQIWLNTQYFSLMVLSVLSAQYCRLPFATPEEGRRKLGSTELIWIPLESFAIERGEKCIIQTDHRVFCRPPLLGILASIFKLTRIDSSSISSKTSRFDKT